MCICVHPFTVIPLFRSEKMKKDANLLGYFFRPTVDELRGNYRTCKQRHICLHPPALRPVICNLFNVEEPLGCLKTGCLSPFNIILIVFLYRQPAAHRKCSIVRVHRHAAIHVNDILYTWLPWRKKYAGNYAKWVQPAHMQEPP